MFLKKCCYILYSAQWDYLVSFECNVACHNYLRWARILIISLIRNLHDAYHCRRYRDISSRSASPFEVGHRWVISRCRVAATTPIRRCTVGTVIAAFGRQSTSIALQWRSVGVSPSRWATGKSSHPTRHHRERSLVSPSRSRLRWRYRWQI